MIIRESTVDTWHYLWQSKRPHQVAGVILDSKILIWLIICFGISLRVAEYLNSRSLWLDEARLALNIIDRSFWQLLQPLDYAQGAPFGFLVIEKLSVLFLGNHEYALRLFPLLAGIGSLFLFHRVAGHFVKHTALPIALALFVVSSELIYYSAEVKQYSSDVAVALLLYGTTLYVQSQPASWWRILVWGVVGAVALWLSFPALFVLAGISGSLGLFHLFDRDWKSIRNLTLTGLLWSASFIPLYFIFLQYLKVNQTLLDYWDNGFMPLPPLSFSELRWFDQTFFSIFEDVVGLRFTGLAAFAFLIGSVAIYRQHKEKLALLLFPILITLIASGFHLYPFKGRLLLFIVPAVIMVIAAGVQQIGWRLPWPFTALFIMLLFFHPFLLAGRTLIIPTHKEETQPVVDYFFAHRKPGDVLYIMDPKI